LFVINYILIQTTVEYFPENQSLNHMDGVEEVYLYFSFIIYLDTPYSRLEDPHAH
jgi:hypothetical protein